MVVLVSKTSEAVMHTYMRPLLRLAHGHRATIALLDPSAIIDPSPVSNMLSTGVDVLRESPVADMLSTGVEMGAEMEAEVEAEMAYMFTTSENWNFVLVAIALALASTFEKLAETLEESVPERLLPVVQKSLSELASLGFVGLIIEVVSTSDRTSDWLRSVSASFLGEPGFLLEQFEAVHEGLFSVTIIYFTVCALLILRVSAQFREWGDERQDAYLTFKLAEYEWMQARGLRLGLGLG